MRRVLIAPSFQGRPQPISYRLGLGVNGITSAPSPTASRRAPPSSSDPPRSWSGARRRSGSSGSLSTSRSRLPAQGRGAWWMRRSSAPATAVGRFRTTPRASG